MKTGTIIAMISMISVAVMFVWAFIEGSYSHAWLAVFIGGIAGVCVSMIRKDKSEEDNHE